MLTPPLRCNPIIGDKSPNCQFSNHKGGPMNTNLNMKTMPIDRLKPAKYNPRKDLKPGDPAYEKISSGGALFYARKHSNMGTIR